MNRIRTIRHLAGILAGLAAALLASGAVSPAAFASRTPPFGGLIEPAKAPPPVHAISAAAAIPAVFIGALGRIHTDAPHDSGLVACAYPLTTQDVPATAYPKIRSEFAGSRSPDLRTAGTAYVDLAIKLRRPQYTDGYETVSRYQRLAAACALTAGI